MFIVLSAFVNVTEKKIPITLILIILFYIIDEIKTLRKKDNIAHIIGTVCGAIFGFLFINQNFVTMLFYFESKLLK